MTQTATGCWFISASKWDTTVQSPINRVLQLNGSRLSLTHRPNDILGFNNRLAMARRDTQVYRYTLPLVYATSTTAVIGLTYITSTQSDVRGATRMNMSGYVSEQKSPCLTRAMQWVRFDRKHHAVYLSVHLTAAMNIQRLWLGMSTTPHPRNPQGWSSSRNGVLIRLSRFYHCIRQWIDYERW